MKKKKELVIEDIIEDKSEPYVPKKIIGNEERQLLWFLVVVAVLFVSFLGPYFYIQGLHKFTFAGVMWNIEDAGGFDVYHTRFYSLSGADFIYNLFLRNDPRENMVPAYGEFHDFKPTGIVAFSPEINTCKGEVSRAITDLGSFLSQGVGIVELEAGTTNYETSLEGEFPYTACSFVEDKTVILVEKGVEHWISQSQINPSCYIIKLTDCEDILPIEKFMIETVASVYDSD